MSEEEYDNDYAYWAEMSEEDLERMRRNRERLQFFSNFRNMTPETYDQLRAVLEDYVNDQPHYFPNWNGPDGYECDGCGAVDESASLFKSPANFVHKEGCLVVVAQHLLTLLPPRG